MLLYQRGHVSEYKLAAIILPPIHVRYVVKCPSSTFIAYTVSAYISHFAFQVWEHIPMILLAIFKWYNSVLLTVYIITYCLAELTAELFYRLTKVWLI